MVLNTPFSVATFLQPFFHAYVLLEVPGDAPGCIVRNCFIYQTGFFDGSVTYNYVRSIARDSSISCYGPITAYFITAVLLH